MSWGERSCKKFEGTCEIASLKTCNVDCIEYESNGKPPDSTEKFTKSNADVTKEVKKGGEIQRSTLKHFSKNKEFIVLKGHVFNIQSVTPKKIILKIKGKTTKEEPIPDGIFVIKEN